MRSERSLRWLYVSGLCVVVALAGSSRLHSQAARQEESTKKVVTFQTEDGKTIYATLHLPKTPPPMMAGAVLFAEPGWILRSTFDGTNIAGDLAARHGMAALTVDFRGTGKDAVENKPFDVYSAKERASLQLDVRGAIKFLSSQKGLDPGRIGVVATGVGADFALRETSVNRAVQAVVLISGSLGEESRGVIKRRHDVPVLCLAGRDDKEGFLEMAQAFALSENRNSNIMLGASGHGTGMFTRTKGLSEDVASWLASNVKGLGIQTEVTFNTPDGWSLHGRLRIPDGLPQGAKVPGVVFIHGNNHDQDTWHDLSRAVTKQGLATLVFDWRGKNRDVDEGKGNHAVDLPAAERAKIHLDIRAAIDLLAAQSAVDATRIALVAGTAPTTDTLNAAAGDDRIRTLVILSQYQLNDGARKYLTSADTPIFFVASTEDVNVALGSLADFTKEAYRLSRSKGTDLLLYDDAGRGSEMLKQKPELEGMIVRWLLDKLTPSTSSASSR